MAHLTGVRRLARKLGATLDVNTAGKWTRVVAETPAGKVWVATGDTHVLVAEWRIA
jgi:hypothetical protein